MHFELSWKFIIVVFRNFEQEPVGVQGAASKIKFATQYASARVPLARSWPPHPALLATLDLSAASDPGALALSPDASEG